MNNLDDYRGRLLARAFHDELEKLSFIAAATSYGMSKVKPSSVANVASKIPAPTNAATGLARRGLSGSKSQVQSVAGKVKSLATPAAAPVKPAAAPTGVNRGGSQLVNPNQ